MSRLARQVLWFFSSIPHSFTHPLIHSPTDSLTHLLTYPPTHLPTYPPTHLPTYPFHPSTPPALFNSPATSSALRRAPPSLICTNRRAASDEVLRCTGRAAKSRMMVANAGPSLATKPPLFPANSSASRALP